MRPTSSTRLAALALFAATLAGDAGAASINPILPRPGITFTLPTPPSVPTALAVVAKSTHSTYLTWTDTSSSDSGYRIERRTPTTSWVVVETVAGAVNGFGQDDRQDLVHNTEYCWRVVPFNSAGSAANVPEVCARTNRNLGHGEVLVSDYAGLAGELREPGPPPAIQTLQLAAVVDAPSYPLPRADKVIRIAAGAAIDATTKGSLQVGSNVTIIGGRGSIARGALLYRSNFSFTVPILTVVGNNVRISGIRFRGASSGTSTDNPLAVGLEIRNALDVVVDHCEFFNWTGAGIEVGMDAVGAIGLESADRIRIADNYFHHIQRRDNGGVGVVVKGAAYATIERNTFDYIRHTVEATGGAHQGYLAYRNLILAGGHSGEYAPHYFGAAESGGWAGEFFDLADNSFLQTWGAELAIRGTPTNAAHYHHNVCTCSVTVSSESEHDNVLEFSNEAMGDPRDHRASGDFDGDGRDDVFITTGRAWYVSYGAVSEWRFLNRDQHAARELWFADHDGDGRTDVLTRSASGVWSMSKSGSGPLTPIVGAPVGAVQARFITDLVGDFTGDGVLDEVSLDYLGSNYGDRWMRTIDGRTGTVTRSPNEM